MGKWLTARGFRREHSMKLIFAIVSNDDSSAVSSALTKNGYSVTKLATTGGFLMAGNTTFISGVEDDQVDKVIEIIRKQSSRRTQIPPQNAGCAQYLHHGCGHVLLFPGGSHRGRFHHLCAERGPLRKGINAVPGVCWKSGGQNPPVYNVCPRPPSPCHDFAGGGRPW